MTETNYLRNKHKTFTYQSYSWKLVNNNSDNDNCNNNAGNPTNSNLKLSFIYKISPDIFFNPSVTIYNVSQEMINQLGKDTIDNYVFNIGLAEMYSYWKTTASQEIIVKAGKLSPEKIDFWQKLLLKGMGEFFYQNKIEFTSPNFVNITSNSDKIHKLQSNNSNNASNTKIKVDATPPNANQSEINQIKTKTLTSQIKNTKLHSNDNQNQFQPSNQTTKQTPTKTKILVPVGGGKDSSVSLEILKKNFEVGTYTVSAPKSAKNIIDVSKTHQENHVNISRVLDPKLFELNENGYLNGHVPISAYLAFLSLLTADLFGYTHIAISNERSSNEGNVWYCNQEINHQYSKSYEFESDLQAYVTQYISKNAPLYFSFLRPLYELQIAQIFSQFSDYHSVFRSCNRGSKQNIWCCECSKCLFAWTIMFPFIEEEKLTTYFGNNLFENKNLWETTKQLLGLSTIKPFDCVGTHEETIAAFYLSIKLFKQQNPEENLPFILEKVEFELKTNPKLQNEADQHKTVNSSQELDNQQTIVNSQKTKPTNISKKFTTTVIEKPGNTSKTPYQGRVFTQDGGHNTHTQIEGKNSTLNWEETYQKRANKILNGWNNENSLTNNFTDILKQELEKNQKHAPN